MLKIDVSNIITRKKAIEPPIVEVQKDVDVSSDDDDYDNNELNFNGAIKLVIVLPKTIFKQYQKYEFFLLIALLLCIYKLRWDSPTRSLFSLLVEEYSGSWSENTAKVSVTSTPI
ncbi:hypothetical protein BpHYR1_050352 [Brachionus plicatilis]|uniref:Uncharacterized protein n=1 Tax=Brachionus plicatilis TaxID=10195 RepID=A0A3M7RKC4_BRAPC|nr:hypothetical protein BpHYR1_050352 [Brachionus plicatilis]